MPRWLAFVLFFTVFAAVWGSANVYVFRRGWGALPPELRSRRWYAAAAVFLATAYVLSRLLDDIDSPVVRPVVAVLAWTGSIWMGFASYLLLACLAVDLARLGNRGLGYFPAGWADSDRRGRARWITAAAVVGVVALVQVAGFANARILRTRILDIAVNKPLDRGRLRIAVASDMHLGAIVGEVWLAGIVGAINRQQADLVLLPGDVVDDWLTRDRDPGLCRLLGNIRSRLGVYGALGNHEYIVGAERSIRFLEACGVSLLRDEVVRMQDGFYLAGRDDVSRDRMGDPEQGRRTALPALLAGIDASLPLILMDHTPVGLEAALQAGVDLQVSGHTHNAQLWPFHFITGMIYEQDWGYLSKGNTHYYVSCGAGTWGPPVRTNSVSEVAVIDLSFRSR